ncbi:hypothetical protein AB1L30_15840 [Bremerella sp. JC817]|uniref:hypothetical protein n=1 Tax=Bremerella sp. JC817 TaxID=3231756 RepID=UPI003459C928
MIRVTCPCCGAGIRAEERLIGQTIRCPKCLSQTKVQRPKFDDLAKPVEPTYAPQAQDDDKPRDQDCPKCGGHLPAGEYLCKQCGYHVKLEAYFKDLTTEALEAGKEPKTRLERLFESQLHELATPREVVYASAACLAMMGLIDVIAARFFFGVIAGTVIGLIVAGLMVFGWYVLMQRIGAFKDPKREERLQKEQLTKSAKVTRDPGKAQGVSEKIAKPVAESRPQPKSPVAEPQRLSLEDEADIDLFAETKPASRKPASTSSPGTAASSPKKEDDWLNELL